MAGDGTESSSRVADVLLRFLDDGDALGVSAVARDLGLSKAVVHRILRSLVERDLLRTDPATRLYRLGPAAVALGARALRDANLRTAALPAMRELQDQTAETTTVSALVGDRRVYLDQVASAQEIKMTVEIGRAFPLHAGSSGRSILAFLPPDRQLALLKLPLTALTPETITDDDELTKVLKTVRAKGIAESRGERQAGAASLAAPVFDVDGAVIGALSVCGPISRFSERMRKQFAPLVAQSADGVSQALGWRGGLPR